MADGKGLELCTTNPVHLPGAGWDFCEMSEEATLVRHVTGCPGVCVPIAWVTGHEAKG